MGCDEADDMFKKILPFHTNLCSGRTSSVAAWIFTSGRTGRTFSLKKNRKDTAFPEQAL